MAFDELLAGRVRDSFVRRAVLFEEKRMMGGLCFMVDGKMCVGIADSRLMVRLDPAIYEESLELPGCRPMDFTGRPMRGFVFVDSAAIATRKPLDVWITKALDFNPHAKASSPKTSANRRATRSGKSQKP